MPAWQYYLWATLLVTGAGLAWLTNLIGMPGNWVVVAAAALFAYLIPEDGSRGVAYGGVALLLGLAALGEVVEFLAGAVGAAKQGASRRAVALAALGAIAGGLVGLVIGAPVPIIGSMVAALLGSAAGAFAGAYAGEKWARRGERESLAAGRGAFFGRLWGALGKLAVGAAMLVVLALDAFWL